MAGDRVETKKFDGIDLYEPAELVLTAKSGTPISDIEALLADHAQHLAFEPPDFRGFTAQCSLRRHWAVLWRVICRDLGAFKQAPPEIIY